MVTIHPISETIPPGPEVVQPKIDLDPVSSFPEHLNPEVVQLEVVTTVSFSLCSLPPVIKNSLTK